MQPPETTTDQELADLGSQLGQLNEELHQLAPDDFTGRIELRERINQVRAEIGEIQARPTAGQRGALLAELQRLEAQWDALADDRIDVVKQAGGGSTGGDFGFAADAMRLNREIDANSGRAQLEARILRLKQQLKTLDDPQP